MGDSFAAYKNPHMDPNKPPGWCLQEKPIQAITSLIDRLTDTLERMETTQEKLVLGLEGIRVLTERDHRREKDLDIAFTDLRSLEVRTRVVETKCRMEPRIKAVEDIVNSIQVKMEGAIVRIAFIVAGAAMLSTIGGGIIINLISK